ncbi:short-chain dehydrogenase reductase 2a-like [Dendronephthya gigantea]|uniref:short-chain dehydrogenase reductase 2a-like n=1 Tax=Dendronephthya gigantea TaxID=151771 RepID=UPI00106A6BCA|nr:short-chain dehydrogenase reductase 2a-like [Dendronephthya gigantea]
MLGLELMGKGSGGDGGVIINSSSIGGVTLLLKFIPVYSATKAAVAHFSRCIALTAPNDYGVRVNCIAPAAVETNMLNSFINSLRSGKLKAPDDYMQQIPKTDEELRNRAIKPSDISKEVMKLISDESKNGQVLLIEKNPQDQTQIKVENLDFK